MRTQAVWDASMVVNSPGASTVGLALEQSTMPPGLGSLLLQAASITAPSEVQRAKDLITAALRSVGIETPRMRSKIRSDNGF
jgi:hypothetical protein